MMLAPSAIASDTCRQTLSMAASRPGPPFGHREQAVDGEAAEAGRLAVLVDVEQLGEVVVVDDRVRQGRSAGRSPARARAGSAPVRPWPASEVTSSSRMASSGGLVTWANSWVK